MVTNREELGFQYFGIGKLDPNKLEQATREMSLEKFVSNVRTGLKMLDASLDKGSFRGSPALWDRSNPNEVELYRLGNTRNLLTKIVESFPKQ